MIKLVKAIVLESTKAKMNSQEKLWQLKYTLNQIQKVIDMKAITNDVEKQLIH